MTNILVPVEGVSALRVQFVIEPPLGTSLIMEFADQQRFAVSELIALDKLPEPGKSDDLKDGFYLLQLASGANSPFEWRQRAESWILSTPNGSINSAPFDILLQSDRILWRPGRAVIISAPDRIHDHVLGITNFCFYENELRRLEMDIQGWWLIAARDTDLTHQVDWSAVQRWPHVNQMTQLVTQARMRLVRLTRPLERASSTLPGASRRLVAELLLQAEVTDRLVDADDKLEVFEDLYELANDRISEFSYFRREYTLELWIIVVLAVEAALVLYNLL